MQYSNQSLSRKTDLMLSESDYAPIKQETVYIHKPVNAKVTITVSLSNRRNVVTKTKNLQSYFSNLESIAKEISNELGINGSIESGKIFLLHGDYGEKLQKLLISKYSISEGNIILENLIQQHPLTKTNVIQNVYKEKIEITIMLSLQGNIVTKTKNLQSYFSNLKSIAKEISNIFETNGSFEGGYNTFVLYGDYGKKFRKLLISKYNISEGNIILKNLIQQQPPTITNNIQNVYKEKIEITIMLSLQGNIVTKTKNLQSYFSNLESIAKEISNELGINGSIGSENVFVLYGDYGEMFRKLLISKYNISEGNIILKNLNKQQPPTRIKIIKERNSINKRSSPKLQIEQIKCTSSADKEKVKFYLENNLEFIDAQHREAIRAKSEIVLENIEIDYDIVCKRRKTTEWTATFPVSSDLIPDDDNTCSNGCICVGDLIFITPDDCNDPYKGKVEMIKKSCDVIAKLEFPTGFIPNGYCRKADLLKMNHKEPTKHIIRFEPNPVIYKRRKEALEHLVYNMNGNPIRDFIILNKVPSVTNNPIEEIEGSYNLEDSEFVKDEIGDHSKLVFDANTAQSLAVSEALKNTITLIQGPPGCGKTITATAIVVALLKKLKTTEKKRIMVCCQSNTAVENFVRYLNLPVKALGKKITWVAADMFDFNSKSRFLRANDEQKTLLHYQSLINETSDGKKYREMKEEVWNHKREICDKKLFFKLMGLKEKIEKIIINESDVVCCTLESSMKKCLDYLKFDTIIIDEATQAVEVASILPIVHYPSRLILIGDQKQLGPVLSGEDNSEKYKFKTSLFVRLLKEGYEYVMLDIQFRMHPKISWLSSSLFYEGEITDGIKEESRECPLITNISLPITYYDCDGECVKRVFSYKNQTEAELVKKIIDSLLNRGKIEPKEIGVISFYSAQVRYLKKILEKYNKHNEIKVATVDSFQGSERKFIIISTVLSNPEIIRRSFILNEQRINVAITRPKYGLIIVGNKNALVKASKTLWSKIFRYIDTFSSPSKEGLLREEIDVKFSKDSKLGKIYFERRSINPFKENCGFSQKSIKSSITGGSFRILWPDNNEDIFYLKQRVKKMVERMNKGNKITIAYDAESVCIQFGQVFTDNFKPSIIRNKNDIPPIGNDEGMIVFFYSKETSKKNDTLMKLVKPLFEHKNVIILTFDFTFDLEILQKFDINPNPIGIIDSQLIDYTNDNNVKNNLILETKVRSLKSHIKTLQYQSNFSKAAQNEIEKNKEKDFPFDENQFIMKITKVPKISAVTTTFLRYSANDVPLTALVFADVLYQNKFEHVQKFTQQKLCDFIQIKSIVKKPTFIREAIFLSKYKNILIQEVNEDAKSTELIKKWRRITDIKKLLSKNNDFITKTIFRFNENQIRLLDQNYEKVEKLLKEPSVMKIICEKTELVIPPNIKPVEIKIN